MRGYLVLWSIGPATDAGAVHVVGQFASFKTSAGANDDEAGSLVRIGKQESGEKNELNCGMRTILHGRIAPYLKGAWPLAGYKRPTTGRSVSQHPNSGDRGRGKGTC